MAKQYRQLESGLAVPDWLDRPAPRPRRPDSRRGMIFTPGGGAAPGCHCLSGIAGCSVLCRDGINPVDGFEAVISGLAGSSGCSCSVFNGTRIFSVVDPGICPYAITTENGGAVCCGGRIWGNCYASNDLGFMLLALAYTGGGYTLMHIVYDFGWEILRFKKDYTEKPDCLSIDDDLTLVNNFTSCTGTPTCHVRALN